MAGVWNNYSSASAWQLLIKFIIKFKWTDYAEATIAIPHEVQSDYNARVSHSVRYFMPNRKIKDLEGLVAWQSWL